MKKSAKGKKLFLVFLLTTLDLLFGPFLLTLFNTLGIPVYSASHASDYLPEMTMQAMILSTYSLALFLGFFLALKQNFAKEMYLKVENKFQYLCLAVLLLLLTIAGAAAAKRTGDVVLILFNLVYYVFAIGFTEEFLIRGVCVYLLKDFSWRVKYLLPNFLFAMLHIFAYSSFEMPSASMFLMFMRTQMPVLMANGCCLQLLKDRTGTLWVPILLHGFLDFSIMFL